MKTMMAALLLALSLSIFGASGVIANDYPGYPDWASDTFSDASDKGSP